MQYTVQRTRKPARVVGTEVPRYKFGLGRTVYLPFELATVVELPFPVPPGARSLLFELYHTLGLNGPSFDAAILPWMQDPYSHSHSPPPLPPSIRLARRSGNVT